MKEIVVKLTDLLLVLAAVLLFVAGWMVTPALGFAAGGISCGAAWFLLGEAS